MIAELYYTTDIASAPCKGGYHVADPVQFTQYLCMPVAGFVDWHTCN